MEKENMTYDQTIELEENIKLKNEADEIYRKFLKNIKLSVNSYKGNGRFLHWEDQYNATYWELRNDNWYYVCKYLNNSYDMRVTPASIFQLLKERTPGTNGVDHLKSAVRDLTN